MRILIIGSGGREHALAWKLKQARRRMKSSSRPATAARRHWRGTCRFPREMCRLVAFAREHHVDFVVPGPELPLTLGVVDAMTEAGIPCFGPVAACARLEGSKAFAKEIMQAAGVPTAACGVFSDRSPPEPLPRSTARPGD